MKLYQVIPSDFAGKILARVKQMPWTEGKARTAELTGTVKQNQEILGSTNAQAKPLLSHIGQQLIKHPTIGIDCVPLMVHPPKFSRYADGNHYKTHTDAPWMGQVRTDLSCTLWLSPPNSYEGGELHIGDVKIKGQPGQALIYECGVPHSVLPVTSGERICAVTWIQSRIRDVAKRKLITDFRRFLAKFENDEELFLEGSAVYSRLLRGWIE